MLLVHCRRITRLRRRWLSNDSTSNNIDARRSMKSTTTLSSEKTASKSNSVSTVRASSPGTVRIRRGTGPNAKEMESDMAIARIMGSDWGDRRKQPVSYAMRLYWGLFTIVCLNGIYTYFAGKDEKYLVEKVQQKVDEKLGRVETNAFVVMHSEASSTENEPAIHEAEPKVLPQGTMTKIEAEDTHLPPTSIFRSPTASTSIFSGPPPQAMKKNTNKNVDYDEQLKKLRKRQEQLKYEINHRDSSFRAVGDLEAEIKRIDQQKKQLKVLIKQK